MANPSKHDQYFTQLKVKYLTGLVSTATTSVTTTGKTSPSETTHLLCDAALEFIDSDGTVYYLPAYTKGN